jgi:hypothetical protein
LLLNGYPSQCYYIVSVLHSARYMTQSHQILWQTSQQAHSIYHTDAFYLTFCRSHKLYMKSNEVEINVQKWASPSYTQKNTHMRLVVVGFEIRAI